MATSGDILLATREDFFMATDNETGQPTEKPKQTRTRRRTGTWSEVIEPATDPPPQ